MTTHNTMLWLDLTPIESLEYKFSSKLQILSRVSKRSWPEKIIPKVRSFISVKSRQRSSALAGGIPKYQMWGNLNVSTKYVAFITVLF